MPGFDSEGKGGGGLDPYYAIAVSLRRIVEECLDARQHAIRQQLKSSPAQILPFLPGKKTTEIIRELLQAKRDDGLSVRYIETLHSHLRRFAARFDANIGEITTGQIDGWLRSLELGARARNNIRGSIVLLFGFARKHGYLPKGQPTEAADAPRVALELGNSPQKLLTNYRELADEEEARAWFAISPSTVVRGH